MTCKVLETIEKYRMLNGVSSLCVGVSGGADSVALLHILLRLREQFGYSVQVVHVNHHLRGEESDRDAAFVKDFCADLKVPCEIFDFDVAKIARTQKQSVELCGRELRYKAFRSMNCDAIAVAHTRSDSIETAIFHMARGTSLKGAAGIPPVNGDIIRPLICCTRSEIEAYIRQNMLSFITDSTNLTDDYARNFIRHQIIRPLTDRFPAFETCFSRFVDNAAITQDFLERESEKLRTEATNQNGFSLEKLQSAHPAVLQSLLRTLLSEKMQKPVEEDLILLCSRAVQRGSGKIQIAPDIYFSVRQQYVSFLKTQRSTGWSVVIESSDFPVETPHGIYRLTQHSGSQRFQTDRRHWIDPQKIGFPLVLRSRLPGDVFFSPIRKQSKTLKKLFNEMKVPPSERNSVAVLASQDEVQTVIWVENVGVSAAFQASKTTDPVWILQKERNAEPHD